MISNHEMRLVIDDLKAYLAHLNISTLRPYVTWGLSFEDNEIIASGREHVLSN